MQRRLPAEWEEQDGVLLAWPHEGTDWRPHLEQVEPVFAAIAAGISRFERVIVAAHEPDRAQRMLGDSGACMDRVGVFQVPTNDTWARDFGPIAVQEDGRPVLLDFAFNGWGLKFPADRDNRVTRRLGALGAFGAAAIRPVGLVLEAGRQLRTVAWRSGDTGHRDGN
jgi:agmatine deiminase